MVKSKMNKSAFSFGAKELCFKFCRSSAIERRTSDFNSRLYVLFFRVQYIQGVFFKCNRSKAGFSSAIDSDFKRPLWGQPQMRTRRNGASRTGSVLGAHICFFSNKSTQFYLYLV